VDLVELGRVRAALQRWGDRLVAKLMDPAEAARLPQDEEARALAVAFAVAAKEAASKAIGTGWSRGVRWRDVVIEGGASPRVRLCGRARDFACARGGDSTELRVEQRGDLVLGEVRLLG
jgi:holo-[acyl-carrier protein] synthase